eukprot:CAMPEP_0182806022 /NCGR_PEP_ID=MMETSP0006_2-20121128/5376_1 /TAXON_ID=97485 /ORGANISM="Prymnesium parvum, Strain Texoma1" /LENGTH=46 /DNA_ID= /DNA_START= /DNA_END= /DNA_ORIENTATION=
MMAGCWTGEPTTEAMGMEEEAGGVAVRLHREQEGQDFLEQRFQEAG